MPLSEAAAQLLRDVLLERTALVERATEKVFRESPDLAGKRSPLVTRMLVDRVFACSEAVLLRGDRSLLDEFTDQVTGIRAEADFHVSTLLFGFRSFRHGIEERACALAPDARVAIELLLAADELYAESAARAGDLLVERQHAALHSRRAQIERENAKLAAELRHSQDTAAALRVELDEAVLTTMRLEQEVREKSATIAALTHGDRRAREILELLPPGSARLQALRDLRLEARKKRKGSGTSGGE